MIVILMVKTKWLNRWFIYWENAQNNNSYAIQSIYCSLLFRFQFDWEYRSTLAHRMPYTHITTWYVLSKCLAYLLSLSMELSTMLPWIANIQKEWISRFKQSFWFLLFFRTLVHCPTILHRNKEKWLNADVRVLLLESWSC